MTDQPEHLTITNADHRRAAALIAHHARNDSEGFNAIITEVSEQKRPTELIVAVLDLYQHLMPAMYTQMGLGFLSDYIHRLAFEGEA